MKTFLLSTAAVLTLGLSAPAIAGDYGHDHITHHDHSHKMEAKKDIIDTASANENFGTLVTAIKAAGLADTLKEEGPYTVFAPTDAAFAKLPEGAVADLLKPDNKDKLTSILTYHVVPGKIKSKDIVPGLTEVKTVQGDTVKIEADLNGVSVDGATVTSTDIMTSNGIIHVIDAVIMPTENTSN